MQNISIVLVMTKIVYVILLISVIILGKLEFSATDNKKRRIIRNNFRLCVIYTTINTFVTFMVLN